MSDGDYQLMSNGWVSDRGIMVIGHFLCKVVDFSDRAGQKCFLSPPSKILGSANLSSPTLSTNRPPKLEVPLNPKKLRQSLFSDCPSKKKKEVVEGGV